MRKGGWKRRLAWGTGIAVALVIIAALTWRLWVPSALTAALRLGGVKVQSISWEGKDFIKATGIERARNGGLVRIGTLTIMRPRAWRSALRKGETNQVFITANSWRIIAPTASNSTNRASLNERIRAFQRQAQAFRVKCPRAVFLNGAFQVGEREFRFATIEWKEGELSGDFTWPQLNDPADFRLNVAAPNKTQLIVKQTALEIGSKLTAETTGEHVRVSGYARWKTNRINLDLTLPPGENLPTNGFIASKGLSLPGDLLHLAPIEKLDARFRLSMTNGRFALRVGPPEYASEPSP